MTTAEATLQVRRHDRQDDALWTDFLARSNNGTLFHDLGFLDYHPPGRHAFCHLTLWRDNKLVALVPGGITAEHIFASPLGASIGGPVLAPDCGAAETIAVVATLQQFVCDQGLAGLDLVLAPSALHRQPSQTVEFACHRRGFALARRWMPLMIPLDAPGGAEGYKRLFNETKRTSVRANAKRGVTARPAGIEALAKFLHLFDDTYARHGVAPTHTADEIRDLLARRPEEVTLWLSELKGEAIGGVLLFRLNARAATTFYICNHESSRHYDGTVYLLAALIDRLAQDGYRYLDLGPSATTDHFNAGVVAYKEGLGAVPFCRDLYSWRVTAAREQQ